MSSASGRKTRKTKRSTKGKRPTLEEKATLAKECKHKRFRFRNCSTEMVCLDCGSVRTVALSHRFGIEFTSPWKTDIPPVANLDTPPSQSN